jgi:2-iminobutanoate/2-iminopropanoate deaminase
MSKKTSLGGLPVGGAEPLIATAVRWGDLLFLSGRAAVVPETLEVTSDNFDGQARFVLDTIVDVLRSSGSSPEEVLRVECYLARRDDVPAWNDLFAEYFPPPLPARTTVVADFGVEGLLIEVQVTAGVSDDAA